MITIIIIILIIVNFFFIRPYIKSKKTHFIIDILMIINIAVNNFLIVIADLQNSNQLWKYNI